MPNTSKEPKNGFPKIHSRRVLVTKANVNRTRLKEHFNKPRIKASLTKNLRAEKKTQESYSGSAMEAYVHCERVNPSFIERVSYRVQALFREAKHT